MGRVLFTRRGRPPLFPRGSNILWRGVPYTNVLLGNLTHAPFKELLKGYEVVHLPKEILGQVGNRYPAGIQVLQGDRLSFNFSSLEESNVYARLCNQHVSLVREINIRKPELLNWYSSQENISTFRINLLGHDYWY